MTIKGFRLLPMDPKGLVFRTRRLGVPQIRGTFFGGPHNEGYNILGVHIQDSLMLGNYQPSPPKPYWNSHILGSYRVDRAERAAVDQRMTLQLLDCSFLSFVDRKRV